MLYAYPMDLAGCGHYRILHPYNALPESYKDGVRVMLPGDPGGILAEMRGTMVMDVTIPTDCSAVLVQRPTSSVMVQTLQFLRIRGVDVIVEIDDDLEALTPAHPTWHMLQRMPDHDAINPRLAVMTASKVVVSTEALRKRYASSTPNGVDVVVLRNRIPEALIASSGMPAPETHVIGWPGAVATHPGDLDTLGGAIARLGTDFTIVGANDPDAQPNLGVPDDRIRYTGTVNFTEWVKEVSAQLSVGLVPLMPSRFNEAKSWLKALELSAAGVPLVRTSLPEFERLGAGLVADKPRQWVSAIKSLIEQPQLWADERERGLSIARANTYTAHIDEWIEGWNLQSK